MSSQVIERTIAARELAPAPVRTRAPRRKSALMFGGAVLIALGATWYGYDWWRVGRFTESTDDAFVGGDVTVIAPKISGFIAAVAVADNQNVQAGDLLLKIDDRDFRAALDKAEAAVAGQQASLANLDAGRRLQIAVIAQAQAELSATDAEITRSRFDVERYHALAQDQFASQQRFQQADADARKALSADRRARSVLEAAIRQLDVIDTQKQQAAAALAGARADRATAQLNLGYTELRAPIDGVIGNRSARTGAFAAIGTQLISLVPAQGLWVDANFKENQLATMRPGQRATIRADVLPGTVFQGVVTSLAPATGAVFSVLPAENATGNFTKIVQRVPVRIALDGDGAALGRLRAGLSVTASVDSRAVTK